MNIENIVETNNCNIAFDSETRFHSILLKTNKSSARDYNYSTYSHGLIIDMMGNTINSFPFYLYEEIEELTPSLYLQAFYEAHKYGGLYNALRSFNKNINNTKEVQRVLPRCSMCFQTLE